MPGFEILSAGLALSVIPAIYRKKRHVKEKAREEDNKKQ